MTTEVKPPNKSPEPLLKFSEDDSYNYQIKVFLQNIKPESVDPNKYPQGTALVEYTIGSETIHDLVMSQKSSNIFDAYYDKLKTLGGKLLKINSWYGTISPKLWNANPKPKSRRNKRNG